MIRRSAAKNAAFLADHRLRKKHRSRRLQPYHYLSARFCSTGTKRIPPSVTYTPCLSFQERSFGLGIFTVLSIGPGRGSARATMGFPGVAPVPLTIGVHADSSPAEYSNDLVTPFVTPFDDLARLGAPQRASQPLNQMLSILTTTDHG